MQKTISRPDYMKLAQEKVELYVPKIEERVGIELGDVNVRGTLHSIVPLANHGISLLIHEVPSSAVLMPVLAQLIYTLTAYRGFFPGEDPAFYVPPNHTIYLNMRKKVIESIIMEENSLDELIVHELGHHLWFKLGGYHNYLSHEKEPREKLMIEGFATYCEYIWFSDFYPDKRKRPLNSFGNPNYHAGALRMVRFVQEQGDDVLLRVPREWRELGRATPLLGEEIMFSTRAQVEAFEGQIIATD